VKRFLFAAALALTMSTMSQANDDFEEVIQDVNPPFPKCTATCPNAYYNGGDTCTAVGKPGQAVSCGLQLGPLGYQPDNSYRQSCKAVCSVK